MIEAVNKEDAVVKYNEKAESVKLMFLDAIMPEKMKKDLSEGLFRKLFHPCDFYAQLRQGYQRQRKPA